MKLPRFPATRSSLPPGSPRRAALIRAAVALSAALVLLVLGLLDRDRPAPPRAGAATGEPGGVTLRGAPVDMSADPSPNSPPSSPIGAGSPAAGKPGTALAAPGGEATSAAAGVQEAASTSSQPSCPAPVPATACPPPPAMRAAQSNRAASSRVRVAGVSVMASKCRRVTSPLASRSSTSRT